MTERERTVRFVFDVSPTEDGRLQVDAHIGVEGEDSPRQSGTVVGDLDQVVDATLRLWETAQILIINLTDFRHGLTELRVRDEDRSNPDVEAFLRRMAVAIHESAEESGSLQYVKGAELAGGVQ